MYRKLPPISVLRTFEAAARLQGFSAAAKELCVTHSAVSQQIRSLEERVQHPLFFRSGHLMLLTDAGKRLAAEVREALDGLEQIFSLEDDVPPARVDVLMLEVMSPIAQNWLIPRLECFRQAHPHIALNVKTTPDLIALEDDLAVDMSLRYGDGSWRGVEKLKLSDEVVFPVCSPDFLERHGPVTFENIKTMPLLRHSIISWRHWFKEAGLPLDGPENALTFDDVNHTVGAALVGQGISLARSLLVKDHLEAGRLVRLFDLKVAGTYSYYLTWHGRSEKEPLLSTFRHWIVEQFQQAAAAADVAARQCAGRDITLIPGPKKRLGQPRHVHTQREQVAR